MTQQLKAAGHGAALTLLFVGGVAAGIAVAGTLVLLSTGILT